MALDGFSALQFVPPVPKVFAKTKTAILQGFLPSQSSIRAFTMPFQMSFSMTWPSWLSQK